MATKTKDCVDVARMTPLCLDAAKALRYYDRLYHRTARNADGSALRVRLNGRVRTWKRDAARIEIPVKYGLYGYHTLTARDLSDWSTVDGTQY